VVGEEFFEGFAALGRERMTIENGGIEKSWFAESTGRNEGSEDVILHGEDCVPLLLALRVW
jgi:hypothetical protein